MAKNNFAFRMIYFGEGAGAGLLRPTPEYGPNFSTRLSHRTKKQPGHARIAWDGQLLHGRNKTASGEKFNTHELTAAHPTLPFGTRLRVTNIASGQSVTVRVNDRGPYVRGRVVDVSYAAAETLGMVGGGVAKVKLDVVQ
jgi:rare lipoprotein A (peptidoglycan hydrolase)